MQAVSTEQSITAEPHGSMLRSTEVPGDAAPGIGAQGIIATEHAGADWIEMHVIADGLQIAVSCLDEQCFVAAAEDVTEKFATMIETKGVAAEKPAHACDQVCVGCFEDEVKMIWHEAIGMYLKAGFVTGLGESL